MSEHSNVTVDNFFEYVPSMQVDAVEQMINLFGQDDILTLINKSRKFLIDNPEVEQPEEITRANLLLVRKFRSMRENSRKSTSEKKTKEAAPALTMSGLLGKLGG